MTSTRRAVPGVVRRVLRDQRLRYLLTGGVAAGVFYGIFLTLWLMAGDRVPYVALVLIANTACAFVTFRMYRDGVFRSDAAIVPGFLRFYALGLASLVGSATVVSLLVEWLAVPVAIAPVLYIAMQPLLFYPVNKFWVFRARRR
ncbi:hypothetical protein GCM10010399_66520 [Dactylosporangium fulvum]|uniref:GtrA family protein n=1 Tax=Dactylosporangium fulvum TaxID=53359 RepID=A0ABY5VUU5_9ACTN|nr:GtrA family protein [Dactylosporangium fulvum]UWP80904.1 GtrA family protein [Dactylosporangium fulvum]